MAKILDWKKYEETARLAIAEGCVLLENKNALPLKKGEKIALFGRMQDCYYKSGTGSGGKVNVAKVFNIKEGLELSKTVQINRHLENIYKEWEEKNPINEGLGWGQEPWAQEEMPVTEEIAKNAAAESDVAIVIIARTAGEDKDNSNTEGSYLLTANEKDMLCKVRKAFSDSKKMVVLLNTGNIIDMSFVDEYKPDAVMYVWQGGMLGGLGTADVLTGIVNPSGKLTDTVAYNIDDYPSTKTFGNPEGNIYCEDIFVGYRYFETFAKDAVRYPFGFGLSYTDFALSVTKTEVLYDVQKFRLSVSVKNTGKTTGKEVVQIYVKAPSGKLGKAARVLVAFEKTALLSPDGQQELNFEIPFERFASYDDSGITGHKSCFVLENGEYSVYAGSDVRSAKKALDFSIGKQIVVQECGESLAPVTEFSRMHESSTDGGKSVLQMEKVPLATRKNEPPEYDSDGSFENIASADTKMSVPAAENAACGLQNASKTCGTSPYQLKDVLEGKTSLKNFVSQLTDEDLSCIIRGEGMGSSLVTPGTASAYGGVSERLRNVFGIPCLCCDDGPSGMRLDCGIKAFSLPNGTMLASTFNTKLVTDLYEFTGLEMIANKVDNLLGPGMNIHRNPLNGRNFEYFSEDPCVTGLIGTAMVRGLKKAGVTGTIKHFCGNNQEKNRYAHNSIVSERALREIYLKGFEIAVRTGVADSVMTTYGLVNGAYTAGSYDLNTRILRQNWGFKGIVMTDWWAFIGYKNNEPVKNDFAKMVRAQNDLYMVCSDGSKNSSGDNTLESLKDGTLKRCDLERSAANICRQILTSEAMKRLLGTDEKVEIINRPKSEDDISLDDIEFTVLGKDQTFDLTYQQCKSGTNYILALDVQNPGTYEVSLTGNSNLSELSQLPCTLFIMGIPIASFTFNGSGGKDVTITKKISFRTRFYVSRLLCAENGLNLKDIRFKFLSEKIEMPF